MPDVVVLGAGLCGLAAASHLRAEHVTFDENERPGGHTRSEHVAGFTFDRGPHILYPERPETGRLIRELLGDRLLVQQREAWIYHLAHDLYTRFPLQHHLYGLPEAVVKDCVDGALEAQQRDGAESAQHYLEWIERSFGRGIARHFYVPYSEKLWAIPLERMTHQWVRRRVPEAEARLILEGAQHPSTRRFGFNAEFWYPAGGGIEELPKSFLGRAGEVRVNKRVVRIEPGRRRVLFEDGTSEEYGVLVSSIPLPLLVPMVEGAPASVRVAAESLEHNSVLCVSLGVARERITTHQWVYFYENEFGFYRASFPMNFNPALAPRGTSSILVEIAYSKHRPLDKPGAVRRTIAELVRARILTPDDEILCAYATDIRHAYVIYDLDHRKNTRAVRSWLAEQRILPFGRYGEWEYFNMDHTIESGIRAAQAAEEVLRSGAFALS
jgi:UDP-galactopyranose mutase